MTLYRRALFIYLFICLLIYLFIYLFFLLLLLLLQESNDREKREEKNCFGQWKLQFKDEISSGSTAQFFRWHWKGSQLSGNCLFYTERLGGATFEKCQILESSKPAGLGNCQRERFLYCLLPASALIVIDFLTNLYLPFHSNDTLKDTLNIWHPVSLNWFTALVLDTRPTNNSLSLSPPLSFLPLSLPLSLNPLPPSNFLYRCCSSAGEENDDTFSVFVFSFGEKKSVFVCLFFESSCH